ncbi:hypothetical protein [Chitinophaga filiformis]|uniref:Uncharacterized protein n=1 Tax=Chitinophaga filiformis TaxID=104663 RepID=A0ABY4HV82_CHIFI|nr:hypothetical protein [Chitinophaga filiformis]UPK67452.1 hypothetical protein MYF79_21140 [Chitinophaga filiformis]
MKDKGRDIVRVKSVDYNNWKGFLEDKKSDKSILERMGRKSGVKIGETLLGFDFMNTDDVTGTFTTPAYGERIDNHIPSQLSKDGYNINLKAILNGQQLLNKLNREFVYKMTAWEPGAAMLMDLAKYSANGEILDIKVSFGMNKYSGVSYVNNTYTSLRVLGNVLFGMNIHSAGPPTFGRDFNYKVVMRKAGKYNQSQNHGNGYNAGWPFYGEHTLSASAIFFGYYGYRP